MSLDPELLRKLSSQQQPAAQTVQALVYSIHRTSPWRELISLESAVLAPLPTIKNKRWILHALLALPVREQLNVTAYVQPWGIVSWSWPERTIIQVVDLHLQDGEDALAEPPTIPNIPAAETTLLSLEVQAKREQALFHALDALLAKPPTDETDLQSLAGLYSGLLPKALYPFYWTRFPATRLWLQPDAPLQDHLPENEEAQSVPTTVPAPARHTTPENPPIMPELAASQAAPHDLSPLLGNWWQHAVNLAETCKAPEITRDLQALEARLRYPGSRLAIVGEFNRGKSTLINLLLERTLVPVGVVPTTTAVTSILYSEQESMQVQLPDGKSQQRPLAATSWGDLVATKQDKNKQLVAFPRVRITLPHPWLRELDAEIIDTPGVNDAYGPRSALALDVLSNADAAVVLIAAPSPLSMTETVFLEQEVLGRHVPHVVVVVSMLDRIEPEQRQLVMEDIREKVATISKQIPIVSTQPIDETQTAPQILAQIRSQIQQLAAHSERRAWRSQQVAHQLADVSLQIARLGQIALDTERLDAAKRAEELQTMQDHIRRGELEWDLIEIELKKRSSHLEQELQQRLDTAKARIIETMLFDLSKTHDPKIWWEQDFPFRLRQHFLGVAREIEPFVLADLGQDMQWLQTRVQKAFQISLQHASPQLENGQEISAHLEQLEIADIQRIRLFTRIGSGAATVVGYLLLGPIGSAISIAGGIISDQALTKRIKSQQQQLESEVRISIERSLQGYFEQFAQRLEAFYDRMLHELHQQQTSWGASKTRILQSTITPDQAHDWQGAIEQALTLHKEISNAIA